MLNICDAHNDLLYIAKSEKYIEDYFNKLPDCMKQICCAYFSYNNDKNICIQDIKYKYDLLQRYSKNKAIPVIENGWFINMRNVNEIIKLRPLYITLSHNIDNKLCGGAFGIGGITSLGYKIIKKLENNNIIVDTAHMNINSFYQFIDITRKPIFNSHTGFDFIYAHKRNLLDNQIKEIINSKGFIGMALYPQFYTQKSLSVRRIAKIICAFWDKFGTKTLGLGSDFNGIDKYPIGIKCYKDLEKLYIILQQYGASNKNLNDFFSNNFLDYIKKNYCSINSSSSL